MDLYSSFSMQASMHVPTDPLEKGKGFCIANMLCCSRMSCHVALCLPVLLGRVFVHAR